MSKYAILTDGPRKTTLAVEVHSHYFIWSSEIDSFRCDCGERLSREGVLAMHAIIVGLEKPVTS